MNLAVIPVFSWGITAFFSFLTAHFSLAVFALFRYDKMDGICEKGYKK